jgi:hypothetical protein
MKHFEALDFDLYASYEGVENPKSEARNSKQYPMIQIRMTKTAGHYVSVLNIGAFEF